MNTALLQQYGVPVAVAIISALAGHWWAKRGTVKVPAGVTDVLSHPAVQTFLAKVITAAQASQHAWFDGMVSKMMPAATPFLPVINQVIDQVENKVVAGPKT